ncbi:UNVERIFIED_CONTAM: hypothetical protein K2H54_015880 [Gekko kuhli]
MLACSNFGKLPSGRDWRADGVRGGPAILIPTREVPAKDPAVEDRQEGSLEALLPSVTSLRRGCVMTFQNMNACLGTIERRQRRRRERKVSWITNDLAELQAALQHRLHS